MTKPKTRAAEPAREGAEVEALKAELARLAERLAALEAGGARPPPAAAAPAKAVKAAPPAPEPISEELVLVLSAAIAAFLGKKPVIRQIRVLSSEGWAHAGRVSIQGSHALR